MGETMSKGCPIHGISSCECATKSHLLCVEPPQRAAISLAEALQVRVEALEKEVEELRKLVKRLDRNLTQTMQDVRFLVDPEMEK